VRRLPSWLVIALAGATALSVSNSAARAADSCPTRAAVERLVRMLISPAYAQEVLEFKPVSPESAAKLESMKPVRRRGASTLPPAPKAPPEPPAPPSPEPGNVSEPKPPEPPISIGKSGNIMRVGSDIHIETDQVVIGDVMAVGGDVTVDGHVEGDVVAMGGDVYVNASGKVDGDVVCMGGQLHEQEGATIGGQRVEATRHGRRRGHIVVDGEEKSTSHSRGGMGGSVVWLIITLGIGWAFAGLAPGRTGRALEVLKREPGTSAVTGILAAMLTVPSIVALCMLVALLCITIIGIPLAIGALFGYFAFLGVLWMWGYVIGAAAIGERLARRTASAGTMPGGAAGDPLAAQSAPSGLTRAALFGVLLISGAGLLGSLFHLSGLGAIGTLLRVLSWITFSGVTLIGAGAWLRAEFQAGTLTRLWGRRKANGQAAAAATTVGATPEAGATGAVANPPAEPPVNPAGA
jgi:hypothetical protein